MLATRTPTSPRPGGSSASLLPSVQYSASRSRTPFSSALVPADVTWHEGRAGARVCARIRAGELTEKGANVRWDQIGYIGREEREHVVVIVSSQREVHACTHREGVYIDAHRPVRSHQQRADVYGRTHSGLTLDK